MTNHVRFFINYKSKLIKYSELFATWLLIRSESAGRKAVVPASTRQLKNIDRLSKPTYPTWLPPLLPERFSCIVVIHKQRHSEIRSLSTTSERGVVGQFNLFRELAIDPKLVIIVKTNYFPVSTCCSVREKSSDWDRSWKIGVIDEWRGRRSKAKVWNLLQVSGWWSWKPYKASLN